MKFEFYIIVSARRPYKGSSFFKEGPARITKKKPSVGANEVAVHVELEIPTALFDKPVLEFRAKIPDVSNSMSIDAEVQQEIANIIQERTGLVVRIQAEESET